MLDKLEKIIAKYEALREESLSPEVFQITGRGYKNE